MAKYSPLSSVIMRILTITAMGLAAIAVSGCAITTAGVKKGDERNMARSVNDVSAGRAIKARMARAYMFDLNKVDVEVAEGIVVLTGRVDTPEDKIEAERIAWSAPNVLQVGNEISMGDKPSIIRGTKDALLTENVRARLIADSSVKARNINIEARNGIVYLLGVARTPEELEQATYVASTTLGAKEVVSYMKVHGDVVTGNAYAGAAGSAPSYSGPAYGSVPNENIQRPMPYTAPAQPQTKEIDPQAPYYVDPKTGERIDIGNRTPIPYNPNISEVAPGPTAPTKLTDLGEDMGKAFPGDEELGAYRQGRPGEAVSVIESAPYYIDPESGQEIPVSYVRDRE